MAHSELRYSIKWFILIQLKMENQPSTSPGKRKRDSSSSTRKRDVQTIEKKLEIIAALKKGKF